MANTEDYLDGLLDSVKNVREDVRQAEEQAKTNRIQRVQNRSRIAPQDDFMEASGLSNFEPKPADHHNLRQAFPEEDFLSAFESELAEEEEGMDDNEWIRAFEAELQEEESDGTDETTREGSFLDNVEQIVSEAKEQIAKGKEPKKASEDLLPPLDGFEPDELDMEFLGEAFGSNVEAEIRYDEEPAQAAGRREQNKSASGVQADKDKSSEDLYQEIRSIVSGEQTPQEESGKGKMIGGEAQKAAPEEKMPLKDKDDLSSLGNSLPKEEPILQEGQAEADLMDLLSGDDTLDEISSLLAADETSQPLEESEAAFEEQVTAAAGDKVPVDSVEESAQTKKAKKGAPFKGLIDRLKGLLSHKEKEPAVVDISGQTTEDLTAENMEILKNLEGLEEKKEGKKEKKSLFSKKKKDKESKEKTTKEPKEKKKKEPKPKKEKKPRPKREPDSSPKIPGKIIAVFLFLGGSIVVLVMIGQSVLGRQMILSEAENNYQKGNYLEAYQGLIGEDLNEEQEAMRKKARLLGDLQKRVEEYQLFMETEKYELALDALLTGVFRYNQNKEEAAALSISEAYDELGQQLEQQLWNQFGIDSQEAVEISSLNRENYSLRINKILEELAM